MIAQIEQGERIPSRKLLAAMSQVLRLFDDEEAMLFVSFGKLSQNKHQVIVKALILSDMSISLEQAEALVNMIDTVYQQYREAAR